MQPKLTLRSTVVDSPDANELAAFYIQLLGWEIRNEEDGWVTLRPPAGGASLAFQTDETYVRPVWPGSGDVQRMMMHLDFKVEKLDEASAHAESVGARLAEYQPNDDVRVFLDPAGHPFCLFEN